MSQLCYDHLQLLREALNRLLRAEWDGASLIVALVVERPDPAVLAADRGVSRQTLVEQLRDAVGALAMRYITRSSGHAPGWAHGACSDPFRPVPLPCWPPLRMRLRGWGAWPEGGLAHTPQASPAA